MDAEVIENIMARTDLAWFEPDRFPFRAHELQNDVAAHLAAEGVAIKLAEQEETRTALLAVMLRSSDSDAVPILSMPQFVSVLTQKGTDALSCERLFDRILREEMLPDSKLSILVAADAAMSLLKGCESEDAPKSRAKKILVFAKSSLFHKKLTTLFMVPGLVGALGDAGLTDQILDIIKSTLSSGEKKAVICTPDVVRGLTLNVKAGASSARIFSDIMEKLNATDMASVLLDNTVVDALVAKGMQEGVKRVVKNLSRETQGKILAFVESRS